MGQIEIDELYVGLDKYGHRYVVPVQAKGGKDRIGAVQSKKDIAFADQKFKDLKCRAVAAQFMTDRIVALFELKLENEEIRVVEERHYKLVAGREMAGTR